MPRTRPAYPPEFRAQIVALHRAGRSVQALSREFEPSPQTIRGWVKAARATGAPDGPHALVPDALAEAEREELRRLRARYASCGWSAILSKAAAWFAQDATSTRSSSS